MKKTRPFFWFSYLCFFFYLWFFGGEGGGGFRKTSAIQARLSHRNLSRSGLNPFSAPLRGDGKNEDGESVRGGGRAVGRMSNGVRIGLGWVRDDRAGWLEKGRGWIGWTGFGMIGLEKKGRKPSLGDGMDRS